MKTKTFDCVEMKNRIQAEMLAEYERNKDRYSSFIDFVKAKSDESDWVREARKKLDRTPAS